MQKSAFHEDHPSTQVSGIGRRYGAMRLAGRSLPGWRGMLWLALVVVLLVDPGSMHAQDLKKLNVDAVGTSSQTLTAQQAELKSGFEVRTDGVLVVQNQ